jgi:ERCC4-type nuclease
MKVPQLKVEDAPEPQGDEQSNEIQTVQVTDKELKDVLISVNGLGKKKYDRIMDNIGSTEEIVGVLEQSPSILLNVKGITKTLVSEITNVWNIFKGKQ